MISKTRQWLRIWGKLTTFGGLGYPRSSSHVHKARGRPAPIPAEVEEIQGAYVSMLKDPADAKLGKVIDAYYRQRERTIEEHLKSLKVGRSTYYRRLRDGEWAMHAKLGW